MSTAETVGLGKKQLAAFFRHMPVSKSLLHFSRMNGMTVLTDTEQSIVVNADDHGDPRTVKTMEGAKIKRFVTSAKQSDHITVSFGDVDDKGNTTVLLECESLGEMEFSATENGEGLNAFGNLGEFRVEIGAEAIAEAAKITDRCCTETGRYALACVCFDRYDVVATDGRRLARIMLDDDLGTEDPVTVPMWVIKYAAQFGYGVDVFENYCLSGEVLSRRVEGRFPDWRQVTCYELLDPMNLKVKPLLETLDKHIKRQKAGAEDECWGVEIPITQHANALLDARFVKAAITGLTTVSIHGTYKEGSTSEEIADKLAERPVRLASVDRPNWSETIMPIWKG